MQRELAGTRELDLAVAEPATIEDAWTALVARHPVLAAGRPAIRFARNGAYAPASTDLADGDEVAMIPPVSGGSGDHTSSGDATSGDASSGNAGSGNAANALILEIRAEPFS